LSSGPIRRFFFGEIPTEMIPIQWGERHYLVPESKEDAFCNYVNSQKPPYGGTGGFFLRDGDKAKPVAGLPGVPKEWISKLLASPLTGKVVEVLDRGRARVDLGTKDGAWKGMRLRADGEATRYIYVDDVQLTSCVVAATHPKAVFELGEPIFSRDRD
jgi:hypothetical protein